MSLNIKENGALRRIAGSTVILDASIPTQFATISNEGAVSTIGDYICSKSGKKCLCNAKGT